MQQLRRVTEMEESQAPSELATQQLLPRVDPGEFCQPGGSLTASSSGNWVILFSSLVAVCGSYAFGNAVGYSSPAETGIVDELGLTTADYSIFGSILTIGAMLGALLSGKVADHLGRRGAMWVSDAFCIVGWLAIFLAKDASWLDVGRFLVGCGIGILAYVVPIYIAEIMPKNIRGGFTSLNQLLLGLGKAAMFIVGSLVNWRILALTGIVPCLLQILGTFFIPESPRWLAKVGRENDFEASLRQLRGKNTDIRQEASDILDCIETMHCISKGGITELLQWKYGYSLMVGIGLMIFQQFGGLNAFAFYSSSIFEDAGFSSGMGTIASAIVQVLMTTAGVLLIDKFGRRPLLLASMGGACLGCVFTGLSFLLQDLNCGKGLVSGLVVAGVLVYLGSFELGMGGIPWIIMSEIFPINVKGPAGSMVNLVSWTGSWIVAYTYSYLFEWSSAGTFFIYAGVCIIGVVFIMKLVPETKGRALEEIQASIIGITASQGALP
ncbi:hypothetical protein MLD38_010504 [Melastoma candidum]|uniref:Uncharacterized protein n=1 Tax=Melastoma candidum TaxID=119954 RepID=A0ACB9R039_9MYRT|nr:hypothetical protein MLD38_010504 [Melastoma candidum]